MLLKSNDAWVNIVNMSNILKRVPDDLFSDLCICQSASAHQPLRKARLYEWFLLSFHPSQSPAVRRGTGTALQVDQPMPSLLTAFITQSAKERSMGTLFSERSLICIRLFFKLLGNEIQESAINQSCVVSCCSSSQYSSEQIKVAIFVWESLSN